eukprot:CAMPEP_0202694870 /NCGR_PEP_ID=MMETSP1385-20130828/8614_1 /ASSEMBLY_ACC=CAM_ASM_000861 /TAXON_ID=933848 /ORGANISM="Elphidium margaritaceum" /LENGTH=144 /DNA_ID=CAMNT_0049350795 /DNA_START=182 /DNA_END=616 /DNA_ORIENTATION=+
MKFGDELEATVNLNGQERTLEVEVNPKSCARPADKRCFSAGEFGFTLKEMNELLNGDMNGELKTLKVGSWSWPKKSSKARDAYANYYDYGYDYADDNADEYGQDSQVEDDDMQAELDEMLKEMFKAGYQKGLGVAQQRKYRYHY